MTFVLSSGYHGIQLILLDIVLTAHRTKWEPGTLPSHGLLCRLEQKLQLAFPCSSYLRYIHGPNIPKSPSPIPASPCFNQNKMLFKTHEKRKEMMMKQRYKQRSRRSTRNNESILKANTVSCFL